MNRTIAPFKSACNHKKIAGRFLLLAALCEATTLKANLIPGNAGFESSEEVVASPVFAWPITTTWARGDASNDYGITPYTDTNNPQSGSGNVVLYQYSAINSAYFSLSFVGQPDPLRESTPSAVSNLVPITAGKEYRITFWANRWVDELAPTDLKNMGFVDPGSLTLPDTRLTLQLYTSTGKDLSGGAFLGSNLAFNPVAGGSPGAYAQGSWTQYSATFVADKNGYLTLFFKIKAAADTSYGGPGAEGAKYGLDNVSVDLAQ